LNYATWNKLYKHSRTPQVWRQPAGETRVAASFNWNSTVQNICVEGWGPL